MVSFLSFLLTSCSFVVMSPEGDVARQQADLIIIAAALMSLVIVPVIILTLFFAWKYRSSNKKADYDPEWHHSTTLEFFIWSVPLLIIMVLATITWKATHRLDPYRPLDRIDAYRPLNQEIKPLVVEVVALDWQFLFIYPEQGIAVVNELAAPVDRPIEFKITASSVMNSFYIPSLAGQIYAMPGMQTKLHAVMNKEGVYDGFSANYSGKGFSGMRFKFHGLSENRFGQWIKKVREQGSLLDRTEYLELEKPLENGPIRYFSVVEIGLYDAILNLCVQPGKMCMNEMMHIDMMGGTSSKSFENLKGIEYDNRRNKQYHED
ncbi:ubiquinol oxidase subunit II [Liberibacter crescens]|nr:ubiquinol oxidase subunit II [Liberibacter crescens]